MAPVDHPARVVVGCSGEVSLYFFGHEVVPGSGGGRRRYAAISIDRDDEDEALAGMLHLKDHATGESHLTCGVETLVDLRDALLRAQAWVRGATHDEALAVDYESSKRPA
jgi:hypothetical protein